MNEKWLYGPEKFPGLSRNGPQDILLRTHCCRHIVADTNVSPFARARNISDFVQKTLCPQQMFPSLRAQGNARKRHEQDVSATLCPRLPGPLEQPRNLCITDQSNNLVKNPTKKHGERTLLGRSQNELD